MIRFLFLLLGLLLPGCMTVDYVGSSYPATTQVDLFFDEADIKIPYPQRELSGRAETGGFRVASERDSAAERAPGAEPQPEE